MIKKVIKKTPDLRFSEFDSAWRSNKLKEISSISSGVTPLRSNKAYFQNAEIPWVKTLDLNNSKITKTEECISEVALKETSARKNPINSILIAMYGGFNQIGRTGLLTIEATTNQAISVVVPEEHINSYFLLHFLNRDVGKWRRYAASSRKDPNITSRDVGDFIFVFPSKEEQEKIARFLEAIASHLSQLRRKHNLLQTYKRGVMQKIFSQQIRFKQDDGTPFPDWEKKSLQNIALDGFSNGVFNDPSRVGKGYRLINVKDMYEGDSIDANDLTLLSIDEDEFKKNKAEYGDIFFTRSSLVKEGIAHSNVLLTDEQDITYDGHLIRFRFNIKENFPQYMQLVLRSDMARRQLVARGKTGTMTTIGQDDIATVKVLVPHTKEQEKIAFFLSAINQKEKMVGQQIKRIEKFKQGLLQKMFV